MLSAAKERGHLPSWRVWVLTLPTILIQLSFLYYLVKLLVDRFHGNIALKSWQKGCWVMYAGAWLSSFIAVVYSICADEHVLITQNYPAVPYVCWTTTVILITVGIKVVLNAECNHLAKTRGFRPPLILSRTRAGWVAASSGNPKWTWMFGMIRGIKRAPPSMPCGQDSDEESVVSNQHTRAGFVHPPLLGKVSAKKLQFKSSVSPSNPRTSTYGATSVTTSTSEEKKGITPEIELQQIVRC